MDAIDLKKEMKAGRKKAVCALKSFINCKYCPTHYKDNLDLSKHLVLHLKNFLYRTLPETDPFQCPKCSFVAPERITLLCHLGTDHASFVIELTHQPTELLDVDMSFVDPKILSEPEPESANRRAGLQGSLAAQNRRPQIPHDFHLRPRLSSCLNPNSSQCPSCQQTFEKQQVLLRHFIWAHQNLEQLVVQDFNLKLSEFMPSAKDLEIVKQKNERKGESDEKDLNDLVPMPLNFFLRH